MSRNIWFSYSPCSQSKAPNLASNPPFRYKNISIAGDVFMEGLGRKIKCLASVLQD